MLRKLGRNLAVDVRSTGTMHLGPVPALPEAVGAASRLGLDISAHVAQPLNAAAVESADLVLGFERMHVATCVVDLRVPRERVFTLPELSGLLERAMPPKLGEPIVRAREVVAAAHARRAEQPTFALPEIADPLGRAEAAVNDIVEQLLAGTTNIAEKLFADEPMDSRSCARRVG
jgi:protein-tyrosine-phosphatase